MQLRHHTKKVKVQPNKWENYGEKLFNLLLTGNPAVSLRDIKDYKEYTNKVKGKCN